MFYLRKQIELGLNFLTYNVDSKRGCLPYFATIFDCDPAENHHDWPDFIDLSARYIEAFIMARGVLNITMPSDVEIALKKLLLSYSNENDGLFYRPKLPIPYFSTIFQRYYNEHVAELFDQGRALWGLLAWVSDSNDHFVHITIEQMTKRLLELMICRENYGYFCKSQFEPDYKPITDINPMPHQLYYTGTLIHPLVLIHNITGDTAAIEIAQRAANFFISHSNYFAEDGSWICSSGTAWEAQLDGHAHARLATLAGIITLGIKTNQKQMIDWAKQSYDWYIRNYCSSLGWCPEFIGRFDIKDEDCETCTVMDAIQCALALTEAGFFEYYELVEKFTRNQLWENQLTDTSFFKNNIQKTDNESSCFNNVAQKVLGGFAGWAAPNDLIGNSIYANRLMNCCGPSGIKSMCLVWNNIYKLEENDLYLNILMERNDKIIEIKNCQPDNGLLTCIPNIQCNLYIKCRSWMNLKKINVKINNQIQTPEAQPGYLVIKNVKPNDLVSINYNIEDRQETSKFNGRTYTASWRGDTVIDISPSGQHKPFYQKRLTFRK
ncbi:MAG: hypothetical protein WC765_01975 [Phycisphaerae bacterium]